MNEKVRKGYLRPCERAETVTILMTPVMFLSLLYANEPHTLNTHTAHHHHLSRTEVITGSLAPSSLQLLGYL